MSNHLGQIYSTTKNAEKYIVLNSQNVELSGNVKLTNGNLEVSNNLIFNTISIGNKIDFKETNNTTAYNILHDNLTANNDASLNNVEISGTIKLPDSSNNGYGLLGQVLTSNDATGAVSWTTPTAPPATSLTGSGFDVTIGTFLGQSSIPQLKANGNNNVHVFYADKTGVLAGSFDITCGIYPNTPSVPQLKANVSNNGGNYIHVFYADIAGQAYGMVSDDRIKWNETSINTDRTIEIVKSLKFYQYDILKEPLHVSLNHVEPYDPSKCKVGFGVIAQEIEELSNQYPELKDTRVQFDDGMKAVEYNNLFALLGATTQMLISRIETLENEVKQLKAK